MASSDYLQIKRRMDDEYATEWDVWWNSLPKNQQDAMAEMGLDRPVTDGRSYATGAEHDAGEDAVDKWCDPDPDAPPPPTSTTPDEQIQDSIRMIVSSLLSSQNIRVDAIALAFASGLTICSLWGSQSNAARKFGIMRQHLNKAVRKWRDMLELPPNPYTASEARRKKLSRAQTVKHWRKRQ